MPPYVSEITQYNLRNRNNYVIPNCRLGITRKSFFPATVTDWNNLDDKIKESPNINIFKNRLKQKTFQPPLYYYHGDRKINIIHTRLRNMCSSLNADLLRVNLKQNASCNCNHPCEDCIHYFLECPQYNESRLLLFSELRTFNISIDLLLAGNENLTFDQNIMIFSAVHAFLKSTKRFEL